MRLYSDSNYGYIQGDELRIGSASQTTNAIFTNTKFDFRQDIDITNSKKLGIGGSYGSSGQVLTSGGSSAAPSWTNPAAGGNSVDLVADGAIAAGKPVVVLTNGKAQQVQEIISVRDGVTTRGSAWGVSVSNNSTSKAVSSINAGTNLAFTFWHDDTNSAWRGQINWEDDENDSSGNLRFAHNHPEPTISGATVDSNASSALAYLGNNKVCILFNGVSSGDSHALIATINPTTKAISYGSSVSVFSGSSQEVSVSYDTDNSRILFIDHNGSKGRYRSASFSGTTITLVTSATDFPSVSGIGAGIFLPETHYDTNAERHVIVFDYGDNSHKGYALSVETSGSTTTAGSLFEFTSSTIVPSKGMSSCFDSANNRTIVQWWQHSSGSGYAYYVGLICNTSTGAVTASGSIYQGAYSHNNTQLKVDMVFEPTNGVAYWIASAFNNSYNYIIYYKMRYNSSSGQYDAQGGNGTAWSTNASGQERTQLKLAIFGNTKRDILLVSRREWVSQKSLSAFRIVTTVGNSNITAAQISANQNFLGFAEGAISDGSTGAIKLTGQVVGNQSGLTAGTRYAVQSTGTLSAAWGTAYDVGLLALSSSSGLIIRKD
jgi:hypothetical protein